MLQFMRQRASSWMIKAVLSVIVLTFVFVGVGNFRDRNEVTAATVNGEKISFTQFQDRYYVLLDNVRQQFGDQINDEFLDMLNLKERALDQLISEALLLQKARELGFAVSDEELSTSIRQMSAFKRNGSFNRRVYDSLLQHNRMTPEMFEQQQRRDMLTQKIRQLITDSVKVSEDEARRWFDWENAEVKIKLAAFKPEGFSAIKPSEEALKRYFDENKEKYKTEEKLQAAYIRFDPDDFTSRVTVDDAEIQQYYEDNLDAYRTEKTVAASHILLKVAKDAPEATVSARQAEAMKIYDMVTSGQDFAACARQYSDDSTSGPEGGALGVFKKQDLVAPFAEQAFSMKAGEISRPVRTRFGWHIIRVDKVNDAMVTPLSQVKGDIKKLLALKKARDTAYEEALRVFDAAINENSVKKAAEMFELAAQSTPLFSRTDKLEGISGSAEFIRLAFDLFEEEISDVVEVGGSYYLFQVNQRLAPEVPELAAVRERVRDDLIARMRDEKAQEEAETFLKMLQEGIAIDEAAKKFRPELIITDYFGRRKPVPEIGHEPEIPQEAFLLTSDNRVSRKVVDGQEGYYVIYLEDRRSPAADAFAVEKDKITAQLRKPFPPGCRP